MLTEKRLPALPMSPLPRRTASTSKIRLSYPTTQEVLGDISSRADELGDSPRSLQPSSDRISKLAIYFFTFQRFSAFSGFRKKLKAKK
jgi:hypothetical protein